MTGSGSRWTIDVDVLMPAVMDDVWHVVVDTTKTPWETQSITEYETEHKVTVNRPN
jgi:hypothetical protein